MIIQYLYSLGFAIILTTNPVPYCGKVMNGCFLHETKQIVVNVNTDNFRRTFYHEAGHALSYNDEVFKKICLESTLYNSYKKELDGIYELMADMYMKYYTDRKYLNKFPKIKNYIN